MTKRVEWGLFIARIVLGVVMFANGVQKFMMMDGVVQMFTQNFGLPGFLAYVTAIIEAVAGFTLLIGVFTELSAALLGLILLGAIITVKLPMVGFFGNGQMPGYEFDLALLALSSLLTLSGSRIFTLSKKSNNAISSTTNAI